MTKDKDERCFFFEKKSLPHEKTKDLILEEAKKQFCEKGYVGASVRDICEAVNANVSAIKYHFGGKEGLYRECFLNYGESRLAAAKKILTKAQSIEEFKFRIKLFSEDFIQAGMENSHTTKLICREIEVENPLIQDIFESTFLEVYKTFADFFLDAQEKNFIRKDVDSLTACSMIFHSLTSSLRSNHIGEKYYNRSFNNQEYTEHYINNLITIMLDGIKIQEQ